MTSHRGRHPAILIVEDEPDVAVILRRVLRDVTFGYDLVSAHSGDEALAYVQKKPVSLVVTDYRMPGMNGLELTAAIKALAPPTPIILITGYASREVLQEAKARGVNACLAKPFQYEHLVNTVRAVLEQADLFAAEAP